MSDLFRPAGTIQYDAAQMVAGAFAANDHQIIVGTYSGWATFDRQTLTCARSQPDLLPKGCGVSGVQLSGSEVFLLGQQRALASDNPPDWKMEILLAGSSGATLRVHALPPGNWRMVRHVHGDKLYLYDAAAGIVCYNRTASAGTCVCRTSPR